MLKSNKIIQSIVDNYSGEIAEDLYSSIVNYGFRDQEEFVCKKYLKKKDKILDLGCGSGRLAVALYNCGYKNIVGVDLTPKMIDLAIKGTKDKNIDFFVGDATKLKFPDESFDAIVFTHNGWSQIPTEANRLKALHEVYRVLKPNGVFIISAVVFRWNLFLILKWFKYYFSKLFRINIWENEFGDIMLYTYENYKKDWCRWIPKFGKYDNVLILFIHYYSSLKKLLGIVTCSKFSIVSVLEEGKSYKEKQFRLILQKS